MLSMLYVFTMIFKSPDEIIIIASCCQIFELASASLMAQAVKNPPANVGGTENASR